MVNGIFSIQLAFIARSFLKTKAYQTPCGLDKISFEFYIDNHLKAFWEKRKLTSIEKWLRLLKKRGVIDIMVVLPTPTAYKSEFAFVNMQNEALYCEAPHATYCWQQHWNIFKEPISRYAEYALPEPVRVVFPDETDCFRETLLDIAKFAQEIDSECWIQHFLNAVSNLDGNRVESEWSRCDSVPYDFNGLLSERSLDILHAASWASVFGAMGTWNDSPHYLAQALGKEEEYNQLTTKLYLQKNSAIMYAVNNAQK